jgi:Bacterial Ig-like domain (group 2)/Regulator of chromosome condensation (RCC1) repeat
MLIVRLAQALVCHRRALLTLGVLVAGCDGGGGTTNPPAPVATVSILPDPATTHVGASIQLTVELQDASGATLTGRTVVWGSLDAAIATASDAGLVSGLSPGSTTITASSEGKTGAVALTVDPAPPPAVAAVAVSALPASMAVGQSAQLTAVLTDADGNVLTGRDISWTSAAPELAEVSSAGLVTALAAGDVGILASSEGRHGTSATVVRVRFSAVVIAYDHTCALTESGAAYCWGRNSEGQLGSGTLLDSPAPVPVRGGHTFRKLAVGGNGVTGHSCGVTTSGTAYCWGDNANGGLGNGGGADSPIPVAVNGGLTFSDITAGAYFSCGIDSEARAWCWGYNFNGTLGDGTNVSKGSPVQVSGAQTFDSIAAGYIHACALTPAGAAYCWGNDFYGQLGTGDGTDHWAPTAVAGGLTFASLSAGPSDTCGLAPAGVGYCWGFNFGGQVGDGTQVDRGVPTPVSGGLVFSAIAVGGGPVCGLTVGGSAYCWGASGVGSAVSTPVFEPTAVDGGLTFTTISAGIQSACGVGSGPLAYCWGADGGGVLGNGAAGASVAPGVVSFQP